MSGILAIACLIAAADFCYAAADLFDRISFKPCAWFWNDLAWVYDELAAEI